MLKGRTVSKRGHTNSQMNTHSEELSPVQGVRESSLHTIPVNTQAKHRTEKRPCIHTMAVKTEIVLKE